VEALDEVLAGASFSMVSEDELLERILSLGEEYRPLLRRIEMRFLSAAGIAALVDHFAIPLESVSCGVTDLLTSHVRSTWNSVIVVDFPKIFREFHWKRFSLLWRGGRDGFRANDFHRHCDGHANILTLISDTNGNIFGGVTPVEWESRRPKRSGDDSYAYKTDPSQKSFLFTLKNPHNFPARVFALKDAIACYCSFDCGPHFCDMGIFDYCNTSTQNWAGRFGFRYTNDTGLDGDTFFTGSARFTVNEIEVFEITP
jgi:hypothetical protein